MNKSDLKCPKCSGTLIGSHPKQNEHHCRLCNHAWEKQDIELIKFCCKFADGWEFNDNHNYFWNVIMPGGSEVKSGNYDYWNKERFPLLIQQAIEGINRKFKKENEGNAILQSETGIILYFAYHQEFCATYNNYESELQSKIAALNYIKDNME